MDDRSYQDPSTAEPQRMERTLSDAAASGPFETPSAPALMMNVLDPPDGEQFDVSTLRDRVTIMLLYDQVVQLNQIRAVWPLWRVMQDARAAVPLWRLLATHAHVDSESVFAMAARVYSFEPVDIPSPYNVLRFAREHQHVFTTDQWERMYELSLIPVDLAYPTRDREEWVFATYDPGHPAIKDFLSTLDVAADVRYAPYSVIEEVQQTVFPEAETAGSVLGPADAFGLPMTDQPATTSSEASTDPRETLLDALERALTMVVGKGFPKAYLIPNATGEIEVHGLCDDVVQHEETWSGVSARSFLTFIRRRILGTEAEESMTRKLYRWIDGTRRGFRVQLLPVRDPAQGIDTTVVSIERLA